MTTQLIPVFAGSLQGQSVQLVDARLLHSFLEVVTRFNDWITRRIEEYEFIDGQDFYSILSKTSGRPSQEYHLTLDMAKELAMVERNEKGRQARRYFIECERKLTGQPVSLPEPKTKKALPGGLTLDQQDAIKALVKDRVEGLPKDKQAKAAITCWSAIKSKYGKSYKAIAPEHFPAVCSLVARLVLEGEFIERPPLEDEARKQLAHSRWLLIFTDVGSPSAMIPVPDGAGVFAPGGVERWVSDPGFDSTLLPGIISAAAERLRRR